MRTLSSAFLQAIHAEGSAEVLLPLVKLSHTDWASDIRLAADYQQVTHSGEIYTPFAFQLSLPDDADEGMPVLRFVFDNVSQELITQFRAVSDPITARVVWVLASQPDTIEAGPFDVELWGIEYDAFTISGVLQIEPILDERCGFKEMTPSNAPGLF